MFKHIYHRVFQLGNENSSYPEATAVNDEEKSIETEVVTSEEALTLQLVTECSSSVVAAASGSVSQDDDVEDQADEPEINANVAESDDDFIDDDDLDNGQPVEETNDRNATLPKRVIVKSAKEFFNTEFIYHFDILEDHDRKSKAGKYRFELKGFQGGIWSVDVSETMEVVNRREDAEIVFTMQQKDFVHIVNGDINPQLAILAKKLRITGDMRKAINFLDLLVPGGD